MSTIKLENIQTRTGSGTITIGASGETVALGSGVTSNLMYPAFEAYLNTVQGISSGVATKIQYDTKVYDTGGYYDNSTNYRYTPLVAGKYFVYASTWSDSNANSNLSNHSIDIMKNGSIYMRNTQNFATNYARNFSMRIEAVVDMNGTDDYLEIFGLITDTSGTPEFLMSTDYKQVSFGAYRIGS
jgi:hypothetical protein